MAYKNDFLIAAANANADSPSFEDEIKFLCHSQSKSLFNPVLANLRRNGWLLTDPKSQNSYNLISSQFDTDDFALLRDEVTLRVRSDCDLTTKELTTSEVTLKVNLRIGGDNGLRRFEFSAPQASHGKPDLEALKAAYPIDPTYPENQVLHNYIDNKLQPAFDSLSRQFDIDCIRNRHVVYMTAEQLGLENSDQTFASELLLDEVCYRGKDGIAVGHHTEWESEILTRVCPYNRFAGDEQYITRNLDAAQISIGQHRVRGAMASAAQLHSAGLITETDIGKAERGYDLFFNTRNQQTLVPALAAQ